MFLSTKDGIICDFCAVIYKNEFVYYSVTSQKIDFVNNFRSNVQKGKLNADMCSDCYDLLIGRVKKHLGVYKPGKIKCDLSNEYGSGTFSWHLVLFDRVNINKDSPDNVLVEKGIMDLNLLGQYDGLLQQVKVTKEKVQQEGSWS